MGWIFGRRREAPAAVAPPAGAPPAQPDPADSPLALRQALSQLNRFINASAGRLPGVAVVDARWITDILQTIVDTSEVRPLEIHALLSLKGMMNDYLPTTLRTYLAVDPRLVDQPRSGQSPTARLLEQLDLLHASALRILAAVQSQDADALATQGNFLRTKFSGSDLDL